jgi:hypothetical protein
MVQYVYSVHGMLQSTVTNTAWDGPTAMASREQSKALSAMQGNKGLSPLDATVQGLTTLYQAPR